MRALLLAALLSSAASAETVRITTTSHGIPHVQADTLDAAGYGVGWAFAKDNACALLEEVVTTRGERSYYFGEDAEIYDLFSFTGGHYKNIVSDTYHRWLFGPEAERFQVEGMSPDVRALTEGYVRGFNAYVRANPESLAASCRGQAWVRPIRIEDIGIRALKFATRASTGYFPEGLGQQIPGGNATPAPQAAVSRGARDLGSNMMAFGRDMTAHGGGLHFSNPHFPWLGIERLWTVHITVPGKIDVMGGALHGLPIPGAGFNATQGWSLTWADNQRALYGQLELVPGNPTQYRRDGQTVDMVSRTIRVPIADGGYRERTVWETPLGPVLDNPLFPWTATSAVTIADVNRQNNRFLDFLFGMATARDVEEVRAVNAATLGNPISNVISADADGRVLYVNNSVTPDVSDRLLEACVTTQAGRTLLREMNIVLLDASRSECAPPERDGRLAILPAERMPVSLRTDYVVHSNNAHVVINADPSSFLTGFSRLVGVESIDALGERTRRALQIAEQRRTGSDGLPGRTMSAENLERIFWESRLVFADTIVPAVVADCKTKPEAVSTKGAKVDLSLACAVLERWDRTDRVDSVGSHLFGRFVGLLPRQAFTGGTTLAPAVWGIPARPDDVIATPARFLVTPAVRTALADAVSAFGDAGVPIDAPLGQVQFVERNGERLPLSGGPIGYNSMHANLVKDVGLTDPIPFADSYMHIVEFHPNGPVARGLLAYSQSSDPASPFFADQTRLYSQRKLVQLPFTAEQIAADPVKHHIVLEAD